MVAVMVASLSQAIALRELVVLLYLSARFRSTLGVGGIRGAKLNVV